MTFDPFAHRPPTSRGTPDTGAAGAAGGAGDPDAQHGPVVHDRRKVDPVTGSVRHVDEPPPPAGPAAGSAATADRAAEVAALQAQVAERTADLQRLQAEYVNYKRRVDRDRRVAGDIAAAAVITDLLTVLDDIDRAREHGELVGGFRAVAESLEGALAKRGLARFGEVGDPFDPHIHEALMHGYSDDVDGPTCGTIVQVGYRLGERILRPARVGVVEPTTPLPAAAGADQPAGAAEPAGATDVAEPIEAAEPDEPAAGAGERR